MAAILSSITSFLKSLLAPGTFFFLNRYTIYRNKHLKKRALRCSEDIILVMYERIEEADGYFVPTIQYIKEEIEASIANVYLHERKQLKRKDILSVKKILFTLIYRVRKNESLIQKHKDLIIQRLREELKRINGVDNPDDDPDNLPPSPTPFRLNKKNKKVGAKIIPINRGNLSNKTKDKISIILDSWVYDNYVISDNVSYITLISLLALSCFSWIYFIYVTLIIVIFYLYVENNLGFSDWRKVAKNIEKKITKRKLIKEVENLNKKLPHYFKWDIYVKKYQIEISNSIYSKNVIIIDSFPDLLKWFIYNHYNYKYYFLFSYTSDYFNLIKFIPRIYTIKRLLIDIESITEDYHIQNKKEIKHIEIRKGIFNDDIVTSSTEKITKLNKIILDNLWIDLNKNKSLEIKIIGKDININIESMRPCLLRCARRIQQALGVISYFDFFKESNYHLTNTFPKYSLTEIMITKEIDKSSIYLEENCFALTRSKYVYSLIETIEEILKSNRDNNLLINQIDKELENIGELNKLLTELNNIYTVSSCDYRNLSLIVTWEIK